MFDLTKIAPKFPLGQTVITPNALNSVPDNEIKAALQRHVRGDWGSLDEEDKQVNEDALKQGGLRLFSRYITSKNRPFWIITEHDRSLTTILMPEDY